jgi:hypothetical protein
MRLLLKLAWVPACVPACVGMTKREKYCWGYFAVEVGNVDFCQQRKVAQPLPLTHSSKAIPDHPSHVIRRNYTEAGFNVYRPINSRMSASHESCLCDAVPLALSRYFLRSFDFSEYSARSTLVVLRCPGRSRTIFDLRIPA